MSTTEQNISTTGHFYAIGMDLRSEGGTPRCSASPLDCGGLKLNLLFGFMAVAFKLITREYL